MRRETISHKLRRPTPETVDDHDRPRTRAECRGGIRPCPYVGCKWNLYLDVKRNGSIQLNFADLEPDQMGESCCLDVADRGGASVIEVGRVINVTRHRIMQIEREARDSMPASFALALSQRSAR